MAKVKVQKELKDLIHSAWWEELAKLLKTIRDNDAVKILTHFHSDEKEYSQQDMRKRQIQVCNALLRLPKRIVEVEEEIDLEEEIEREEALLEIWDVDELFTTQE